MKHCSLFCAGVWPFLILPLLLLYVLLYFMWHPIEQRVAENAQKKLGVEQSWAIVETFNRGRDVLLSGIAPSAAAAIQAKQAALNGEGVRTVTIADAIAGLTPVEYGITFEDDKVIMSGVLNNQTAIDDAVAAARNAYGEQTIINQIKVGNDDSSVAWPANLLSAAATFKDGVSISVYGSDLILRGTVTSHKLRDSIAAKLGETFNGQINNQLIVDAPVVLVDECLDLFTNVLATAKINFERSEAAIKPESYPDIEGIADVAKRCPDTLIEISGHSDSSGSLEWNLVLSEQRAQAVVTHLVNLGLKSTRFRVRGYGPTNEIASNTTQAGRAANRRIEFRVIK